MSWIDLSVDDSFEDRLSSKSLLKLVLIVFSSFDVCRSVKYVLLLVALWTESRFELFELFACLQVSIRLSISVVVVISITLGVGIITLVCEAIIPM